ncbi:hypothetical protein VCHA38O209_100018 [Vibrio chagasii]|nr:hypothetical protein VCHA38O209_100018 [Vibrio chagasii]
MDNLIIWSLEQFSVSQAVIEALREKFGKTLQVDLLMRGNDGSTRTYHSNVSSLKPYLKPNYTVEEVNKIVGI